MNRRFYLVLTSILLCIIFSCKEKIITIPEGILLKEELIPVLADIQTAQASLIIFEYTDTLKYSLADYKTEILKKKNITPEQFETSMKFYISHPELLREMYDQVINEISRRQSEMGEEKAPEN